MDGFNKRTPFEASINAHVDWATALSGRRLVLLMDVFNLGNLQRVIGYSNLYETSFAVLNPDYGLVGDPVTLQGYQTPQQIRFGARFEF